MVRNLYKRNHVRSSLYRIPTFLTPIPSASPSAPAQLPTHCPPPSLTPLSALLQALRSPTDPSPILLTLQCSLHRVIVGAMGECTLQPNGAITGDTGRDGPIQNAQAVHKTRETTLKYTSKVFAVLSKLGEWKIEFKTIKGASPSSTYNLTTTYINSLPKHPMPSTSASPRLRSNVTHSPTVCCAIPITQASDETKASL
ncbi:hypothetical protein M422DRAFT_265556 [Sphaerobolus stellatus SS14]|uniref:Uncharacterized protein n=1 Tax=Sphaerobolus stellatus (strain SS14) TaxID=990650 RepID=A0A0C9V529_SPHS4|nr:hypothetical protein M422DRAFT_265556 [Sphaerobolus stellatus SS14]